jgi:molecular chaperone DnaK
VRDNQTSVVIQVLQGERKIAAENRLLARFRLEGIAPAPREVPEIEVSFTIDANGILSVAAMDLTTGSLQQVVVESYRPYRDGEAERMIQAAERRADEDRQFVRKLAVRRRLDEINLEFKGLQERAAGTSLTEEQERQMREAIFRLDAALTGEDWARIDEAERHLKSLFAEILVLLGATAAFGAEEIVFESVRESPEPSTVQGTPTPQGSAVVKPTIVPSASESNPPQKATPAPVANAN